jgi:hypothetical protein
MRATRLMGWRYVFMMFSLSRSKNPDPMQKLVSYI